MRSSFQPALVLMAGRAAGFAVTFFIPVILARLLDQHEFGTYKQAFLIYSTLYGIAQLGMAESLFYFLPSADGKRSRYIANSMLVLGAAGLACTAALAFGGGAAAQGMNNAALAGYTGWVGAYLLLTLTSAVLEIVMISRRQHRSAAVSYAVSDVVRAVLLVVPVLLFRDIAWLFAGAAAFGAARLAATLAYLRRLERPGFVPDASLLKVQLRYAIPFSVAVLLEVVYLNLHQYVVSYRFDAATFAVYSVGIMQIPLVDFLATSASSVMMVRMREHTGSGRTDALLHEWHETTRKLALIFFPLSVLLVLSAPAIVTFLFTPAYAASIPVFAIWSAGVCLAAFQTDGVLRVFAATRALFVLNICRLALVASSIAWFLSAFGLAGAVVITLLATLIAKAGALGVACRLMRVPFRMLLPWRSLASVLAASLGAGLLALPVRLQPGPPPLASLVLTGTVFTFVYLWLLTGFSILRTDEQAALRGLAFPLRPAIAAPGNASRPGPVALRNPKSVNLEHPGATRLGNERG